MTTTETASTTIPHEQRTLSAPPHQEKRRERLIAPIGISLSMLIDLMIGGFIYLRQTQQQQLYFDGLISIHCPTRA